MVRIAHPTNFPTLRGCLAIFMPRCAGLGRHEQFIKKFRLIDVELTSDDPELTATMKLKRKFVCKRFEHLVESMY